MNAVNHAVALARFTVMRLQAASLMDEAARMAGLPPHLKAQAEAASNLLNMRLHQISLTPIAEDAGCISDNLVALAKRVVDPLVKAIGDHAYANLPDIKPALFTNVLYGAIDGEATFNLKQSAERIDEEQREYASDPKGWERAKVEGVD